MILVLSNDAGGGVDGFDFGEFGWCCDFDAMPTGGAGVGGTTEDGAMLLAIDSVLEAPIFLSTFAFFLSRAKVVESSATFNFRFFSCGGRQHRSVVGMASHTPV